MSDYTVDGLYLAGGFIAIGVGIWLGLFILRGGMRIHKQEVAKESRATEAVEESYQQEAVEKGLAPTVVEMYREDKQSVKDIAYTLGITAERVYDILETEMAAHQFLVCCHFSFLGSRLYWQR